MSYLSARASRARHALQTQSPTNLFEAPTNIIKAWRAGAMGAKEWQTSTYSYNKQAQKTLPVAATVTQNLLNSYVTLNKTRDMRSTGSSSAARGMVSKLRRGDRTFISDPSLKDHGDKLVLTAFMFDGAEDAEEERRAHEAKRLEQREERKKQRRNRAGFGARPARSRGFAGAGKRRAPATRTTGAR